MYPALFKNNIDLSEAGIQCQLNGRSILGTASVSTEFNIAECCVLTGNRTPGGRQIEIGAAKGVADPHRYRGGSRNCILKEDIAFTKAVFDTCFMESIRIDVFVGRAE